MAIAPDAQSINTYERVDPHADLGYVARNTDPQANVGEIATGAELTLVTDEHAPQPHRRVDPAELQPKEAPGWELSSAFDAASPVQQIKQKLAAAPNPDKPLAKPVPKPRQSSQA